MFESDAGTGMSRRQALKRGAVVAGTAMWVTPALQVLSMSSASAQQPSGGPSGRGSSVGHANRGRRKRPANQLPAQARNRRP